MSLLKAIEQVVKQHVKLQVVACKVVSVDKAKQTIVAEPINGDAEFHGVRLKAVIDSADVGIVVFPEVDSTVLVGLIENEETAAFVVAQSALESCLIALQTGFKCELKSDGTLELNEGNNGGLINLSALVAELNKTKAVVDAITTVLQSWTPVASDGGAALKAAAGAALAPLSTGNYSNPAIEDTKVKH